jgi:hypothetical protein
LGGNFEPGQWHELSGQCALGAAIPDNLGLPTFGPQIPQVWFRQKHNAADLGMSRRTHYATIAIRASLLRYSLFAGVRDRYLGVDRAEDRFE